MRKYFTWRCIGLHLLLVVLVPSFLLAGWWQYHVALGGNDLSWVYTVEWPFFAIYAVYVWWKMIHDRTTMLDRLWAVKARAAANAEGKPLHEIPGWAMDKGLSRDVVRASLEAARLHELGVAAPGALASGGHNGVGTSDIPHKLQSMASLPEVACSFAVPAVPERASAAAGSGGVTGPGSVTPPDRVDEAPAVIDAEVVEDKVVVDEELDAYNRYLAELSWRDPPKRWRSARAGHEQMSEAAGGTTPDTAPSASPALGDGDARRSI